MPGLVRCVKCGALVMSDDCTWVGPVAYCDNCDPDEDWEPDDGMQMAKDIERGHMPDNSVK